MSGAPAPDPHVPWPERRLTSSAGSTSVTASWADLGRTQGAAEVRPRRVSRCGAGPRERRAAASMTAWACIRPGWRVSRSIGSGDRHGGHHAVRGAAYRRGDGRHARLPLADRLGPAAAAYARERRRREARALQAAVQPLGLLPGHQDLRGGARLHRERGADRDGVPQSGQPLRRRHAYPHVALPAVELGALARHVAQVGEYRSRRGQQAVLAGRRGELREPRTEDEPALHVPRHHPVVFQSHGEAVGRGSCEPGRRDQPGEGGRTGLQCAQYQSCLVENADAARVVHETILASHTVKRKFNFPWNSPICRCGPRPGSERRPGMGCGRASAQSSKAGRPAGRRESDGRTLAEKVWDDHVVRRAEGEPDLLFIDLHLLHEVTSPQAFDGLRQAGRKVRRARPHHRDRGPQHPHPRHRQADRRPGLPDPAGDAAQELRGLRRTAAPAGRRRAGRRPRRGTAAGTDPARHHRGLR